MKLLPLGIQIYQSQISDDFYNFLLNEYNDLNSYEQLHQNENFWDGKDFSFLKEENRTYIENSLQSHVTEYIGENDLKLNSQWVNIQAHDGFLPLHDHYGILSYVIYLKIPKYKQNYWGKGYNHIKYSEGAIQFAYGHPNSLFPMHRMVHPEEKMILIFPSEVMHYVYPFRDRDSERVSISGNFVKKV